MKKTTRFVILLAVLAICFAFLWQIHKKTVYLQQNCEFV